MRAPLSSALVWASLVFVIALVVAALAAALFALLTSPGTPCETIDATSITRETATELRTEGWYADSTDDYERLYSEGCLTRGGRGVSRDAQARDEAKASQWARIEEVTALPPDLRERLYDVLLDAVPHLAAEKQLFRAVSTVLGAILEHNATTLKRS